MFERIWVQGSFGIGFPVPNKITSQWVVIGYLFQNWITKKKSVMIFLKCYAWAYSCQLATLMYLWLCSFLLE